MINDQSKIHECLQIRLLPQCDHPFDICAYVIGGGDSDVKHGKIGKHVQCVTKLLEPKKKLIEKYLGRSRPSYKHRLRCGGLRPCPYRPLFFYGRGVYKNTWLKGVYVVISAKRARPFTSLQHIHFFYNPAASHFHTPNSALSFSPHITLAEMKNIEVKRKSQVKCEISTPSQRPNLFSILRMFFVVSD